MSYSDLKGKVFIVTGASSGMGKAISLLLAKQGAKIGLLDLRKPDHVLEEIEKAGAEALSVECNVQDADAVDKAVQRVALHFGRLDGAANMAGYLYNSATKGVPVADLKDKDWDNMISTNLNGVKNSIRAELNHMKSTGSIVNAGSISGQQGSPNHASYSVSKWGVIGLSKVVAQEVGERGIRVNAVAPGFINTPLAHSITDQDTLLKHVVMPRVALKRIAEPEEVAKVILFLFSEEAGYITGSVVNIDGGYQ